MKNTMFSDAGDSCTRVTGGVLGVAHNLVHSCWVAITPAHSGQYLEKTLLRMPRSYT